MVTWTVASPRRSSRPVFDAFAEAVVVGVADFAELVDQRVVDTGGGEEVLHRGVGPGRRLRRRGVGVQLVGRCGRLRLHVGHVLRDGRSVRGGGFGVAPAAADGERGGDEQGGADGTAVSGHGGNSVCGEQA
ncbi:hypothetical protein [Streptomyces avermitilis]|uniref:hypothetical protein n=1 Tax=Streptomyces avermitilis TaxID=33903 RepID=UPI003721EE52